VTHRDQALLILAPNVKLFDRPLFGGNGIGCVNEADKGRWRSPQATNQPSGFMPPLSLTLTFTLTLTHEPNIGQRAEESEGNDTGGDPDPDGVAGAGLSGSTSFRSSSGCGRIWQPGRSKSNGRVSMRCLIGPTQLLLAATLVAMPAYAQMTPGSTGGTIGKTSKSVSGGGEEASAEPRAKPHATNRASVRPGSEARLGSFDGTWTVSATPGCLPAWSITSSVSNGVISGGGATGQVSRAGAVRGHAVVLGFSFDFVCHYRGGGQACGTLVDRNGCPGKWTATKS
jgi:hypothetical protein